MNRINLIWEERNEYWERFHYRFQLACLLMIALMFVLLFIYG